MKEYSNKEQENNMVEAARHLVEQYETEEWYEDMTLEEFIRMEVDNADPLTKEAIFAECEDKEQAIQRFIHVCEYQYKY